MSSLNFTGVLKDIIVKTVRRQRGCSYIINVLEYN